MIRVIAVAGKIGSFTLLKFYNHGITSKRQKQGKEGK